MTAATVNPPSPPLRDYRLADNLGARARARSSSPARRRWCACR